MPYPAHAKQQTSATIPYKKIQITGIDVTQRHGSIKHILRLPCGQRIITYSWDGSFRVLDLETGAQVGEKWEDKEQGLVMAVALSPDGKTLASGSEVGAVRLWNVDTGKVINKWTWRTKAVKSVCWSSDGGRVVSGSEDGTFKGWDVESGRIILGPIKTGQSIYAVCYSPDVKMIATAGSSLKVWDANTGKLLKTLKGFVLCLVWTSDGKTLIAAGSSFISKFDTTTWSETAVVEFKVPDYIDSILLSPNERILASTSYIKHTAQLWNLETNQPIEPPLYHEGGVRCAAFSADDMFLTVGCSRIGGSIYTWDTSAIIKEVDLPSNNVDATQRPAPKITGAPHRGIPSGFFDDTRRADLSTSHIRSHGQHDSRTPPRQRTFPSFWRRHFNLHGVTERGTQSSSSPFSWTRNLVSGMVRRRDGSDIELQEPPIVEVPCTAGQPRNYHARRKKPASNSSQPAYATQQPPPTATASIPPAIAGASGTTGTASRPHIPITGWRARLKALVCCIHIQNTD